MNSATRVRELLLSAKEQPESRETAAIWADVLGVERSAIGAIAQGVGLVAGEVEAIRAAMAETDVDPGLYTVALNNAALALGTKNLSAHWKQHRHHISDVTLQGIGWCAHALPSDDAEVAEGDLSKLRKLLSDFEAELASTELDDALRAFLLRQMATIRRALAEYRVVGAKAFDGAFTTLTVDLKQSAPMVERMADSKLRQAFKGVLKAVAGLSRFADTFLKVNGALEVMDINLIGPGPGGGPG
ncbi:hypothetical protein [Gaopeijia maritima]|uniref:Uncharacterized protein n=1 Tax=Gaopeijia maritima TaxID=3119007 RepID=A0ABU9EC10_9BACT